MSVTPPLVDPAALFTDLDLGDARRDRRFARVVRTVAENPGASLPQLFPNRTDYHAALQLFDAPDCSHNAILDAHRTAARDAMQKHQGVVLLLHDATTLDFSGHTTLEGELGPVGNGGGTGWIAHQSLAVDPTDRTAFGLVGQILHVREPVPKGERIAARRDRVGRESRLWQRGLDAIGPTPANATWIDVCDRGADLFEFLQQLADRGRRFVVRSTHNRALGGGPSDAKSPTLLHDKLRSTAAVTHWELPLPATPGRASRVAKLSAAAVSAEVCPPQNRRGEYRQEALAVNAVRVWEADPPAGVTGLEWLLLTGEPVGTAAEVRSIGAWYACRMQIEEYHKVQKSGCRVEGYQLQSAGKMAAWVALLSVVAVGLMNLRLAIRTPEIASRPASEFVPGVWVEVLSRYQKGKPKAWTAGEFWVALARLGGYQKDPRKHPPGWITLWRGWRTLHPLIRYHTLARPEMA